MGRLQVIGIIPIHRCTISTTPCTPRSSPTSPANPPLSQSQSYQEPYPRTSISSQIFRNIKEVRHLSKQRHDRAISTPCRVVCHNQRCHVQFLEFPNAIHTLHRLVPKNRKLAAPARVFASPIIPIPLTIACRPSGWTETIKFGMMCSLRIPWVSFSGPKRYIAANMPVEPAKFPAPLILTLEGEAGLFVLKRSSRATCGGQRNTHTHSEGCG